MASSPQAQGTLNKVRASVVFSAFPGLNVNAPNCAKEGISASPNNDASLYMPTLTGAVTSPEPYQIYDITMHILRTQGLAAAFKAQIESLTNVGDITVIPDASTLPNYQYSNCTLLGVNELLFNGTDPGFVVRLRGTYNVNSQLYTLA